MTKKIIFFIYEGVSKEELEEIECKWITKIHDAGLQDSITISVVDRLPKIVTIDELGAIQSLI